MATIIVTVVSIILAISVGVPVILVIAGLLREWREPKVERKLQRLFSTYDHLEVVEDRLLDSLYSEDKLSNRRLIREELRGIASRREVAWKAYMAYAKRHPKLYKSAEKRRLMS